MRITNSFIERVLSGDATPDEKKQLAAFFRDNPGKLAQYMTEESWLQFIKEMNTHSYDIPSNRMREAIEASIGKPQAQDRQAVHPIMRRLGKIAAAAAIVLTAGFSVFYWIKTSHDSREQSGPATTAGLGETKATPPLEILRNTSNRPRLYSLQDGSTVKLAALSGLSYDKTFASRKRDFFLQGQGTFTVKKDLLRPFIVHSQGIATTALGTVFGVDDRNHAFSVVHLYSGRVVVRKEIPKDSAAQNIAGTDTFKDVYLLPGQQLVLNKVNYTARVGAAEPDLKKTDLASAGAKNTYPKQLQFTREPLPQLFSQLQNAYGVKISYDSTRMKNMDFTGIFNHDKETLDSFLGVLCDLNGLTLIKRKAGHFLIREN